MAPSELFFFVSRSNLLLATLKSYVSPYSTTGCHEDTLFHGKTLLVIPSTNSDCMTLPLFAQTVSSYLCGHVLLIEIENSVYGSLSELLAARGWEGVIQLRCDSQPPGKCHEKEPLTLSYKAPYRTPIEY